MDGKFVSTYLLPAIIALIMFNLGLSQSFRSFRLILKHPSSIIVGLIAQMVLLPAIAFAIAWLADIPMEFKIGIVLIAICPGGATANLITYFLKGNVALSLSLTSVNSLLILVTIPLLLAFSGFLFGTEAHPVALPFWETVRDVFVMIVFPVIIGVLFRQKHPQIAKKTENILKYVSTGALAVVFTIAIVMNKDGEKSLMSYYFDVLPFVLLLNVLGMLAGYYAGRIYKFNKDILITLPVEVGIQNSTLAITLAISSRFLDTPLMAVPAIVYGMFTFFSALVFGLVVKKLL